jgi:hypothetical protein
MSFTADEVESIIKKLTQLKETHTMEQVNKLEEFLPFRTQNRMLYEMVFSKEGVNDMVFKEMMKMKRRLEAGEDQYSVDVRFGQFMAKEYIDPVIKK